MSLHVSTTGSEYEIEIQRLGDKNESLHTERNVKGKAYAVPENASAKGCGWPVGWSFEIPKDWKTGYYRVTFRTSDGGGKYVQRNHRRSEGQCYFVLRSGAPGKNSKILLQLATNTYNAYNNWGGSSLYGFHGHHGLQGHEVSFLRPPRSLFTRWEYDFVRWAERNGYAIDYATNLDLHERPEIVSHYDLILSIGHDEYWSWEMRDTVEQFAAAGGNVVFFSGNTCCWQVRLEKQSRSLVCWKQWFNQDSHYTEEDKSRLSSLWSHHLIGRPENSLTGVGFIHGGYHLSHDQLMDGSGAFTVHRPDHWLFANTKLSKGDEFGGQDTIVGYECDGCEIEWKKGLPYPTHNDGTPENFEIFATAPAKWHPGDAHWYSKWPSKDHSGHAVMGLYTTEGGGTVVTVGTTDWAHGLKRPDPIVEQITKNILNRLGQR